MKISTRSRYGVRLMIALAAVGDDKSVFLKDIAASEDISEKYLSLIVIPLKAAGLIRSIRGARGGYVLAREPKNISLCDIVEAVEGETCLVNCVKNPGICRRVSLCPTRDTWTQLGNTIKEAMTGVTLAQLVAGQEGKKGIPRPKSRQIKKG
jgi:Rrf2 family protein